MHTHNLSDWQHEHDFAVMNKKGERRTKIVLILTFFTMLLEIAAGSIFGSMALLADGWHMATHVAAFMITLFAYRYSRKHAHDETFAFSTAKVSLLGGFASSIALGVVALMMLFEALQRLVIPHLIHFNEAIVVATFGLVINFISALLLRSHDHAHTHHAHEKPGHQHTHHDHNLKAAYAHVLADALTSVLAIIALLVAKYYGWLWLDAVMAMVGALIIMHWSLNLIKETAPILLDESITTEYKAAIISTLESDADNRISDLHIWRVGPHHYAIIVALVTDRPKTPRYYKNLLSNFHLLKHITIEVNHCPGDV
jgi:cation diffusion facilitator family transporter